MTPTDLPFLDWLEAQTRREDSTGDLALWWRAEDLGAPTTVGLPHLSDYKALLLAIPGLDAWERTGFLRDLQRAWWEWRQALQRPARGRLDRRPPPPLLDDVDVWGRQ